ncbi:MAG: S9 family peptidase [Bacteroidota bacterium]|nr:S9 family peptidase [Bacteroidota bacterium]
MHTVPKDYPQVERKPKELTIHGDVRQDPYYWLNEREDPEVIQYLKSENEYTQKYMSSYDSLRETIYNEIIHRIKQEDESQPYLKNGYWYFHRFETGKEYPVYYRKKEFHDTTADLLLDVNILAENYSFYQLGSINISPNNKILAFSEDTEGRRKYKIRFLDLESGNFLSDYIENTNGITVFANNSHTVFYVLKDEKLRESKIKIHELGTPNNDDLLIYDELDESYYAHLSKTRSGKYILISSSSTVSSEYQLIPADEPYSRPKIFSPRERDLEYYIDHHEDQWIIRTNWRAPNFRLMSCSPSNTERKTWKEIIPHNAALFLEDVDVFKNFMALSERREGLLNIKIIRNEQEPYYIDLNEVVYDMHLTQNYEYQTDVIRLNFNSLKTPPSVYELNVHTKKIDLLKQQEIIGGYNPTEYHTDRIYAQSHDGTSVPISLVYKKSLKSEKAQALLLYGYGSYGITIDPGFSLSRISLLDRGFIFAIAHIRGGQELGKIWYEQGKLLQKKNTFYDYIACAEHLIKNNFTSSDLMFAYGGSAGGLLMGAVINLRPDLWKAVIAAVPFVDVLTTMLDDTVPLTTGEYDEWGNPNEGKYYHYMKSYSPYDNIEPKEYPAMLVTTGLHDSQVQYWEPAKWVSKLRHMKKGNQVLLLHCNMETGHSGASGRFKVYKDIALDYTFLLSQLTTK